MMIKKIQRAFFAGIVLSVALAGCKNSLYLEDEVKSPDDVMSISVIPPNKMLYKYGEPFDKTGMAVTVYFRDSEKYPSKPADNAEVSVSGYNSHAGGIQTITVSAQGKSKTLKIALMVIPPSGAELSIGSGGTVTLDGAAGSSDGSWEAYVYNESSGNQVYTKSGSGTSSVSFSLPAASAPAGTYIIAAAFRIDAKMHYRFYKLTIL